ncbi:hypothetical protein PAL_GLEAN10015904 [Pteropus alecto]|uniref:Uncharacterized protein n=1 Tax=Pteropus alecto TaxID=9402 RepID=L5KZ39_PTEAL|nr:hypothetical protein PAL_GLEAN10015904 [Pteropus alecto]
MAYCRQEGREREMLWRPAYEGLQGTCGLSAPVGPGALRPHSRLKPPEAVQGTLLGIFGAGWVAGSPPPICR